MTDQLGLWERISPPQAVFRPIHYLGSKVRLLNAIHEAIDDVDPNEGAVCDPFSGSGVIAAQLARRRAVVAADMQEYARVLASAQLAPAELPPPVLRTLLTGAHDQKRELCSRGLSALLAHEAACLDRAEGGDPEALCDVLEHGSIFASERNSSSDPDSLSDLLAGASDLPLGGGTVLTRYYGGVYFSYEQAAMLDGLAAAARELPPEYRDVALAAVLSTASDVVSSVGNQFAQPVRPRDRDGRAKPGPIVSVARQRRLRVAETFVGWLNRYANAPTTSDQTVALCADYRSVLADPPFEVSVVYADPPYTRDHYSRFYHVLETIARGDEPDVSTVRIGGSDQISRGLYRAERHQSPFCIKSQAPGAFQDLFLGARRLNAPLVVSYSPYADAASARPRLMTIEHITELARELYAEVEVRSAGRVAHSKLNAERVNNTVSYEAEVLIICRL